MQHHGATEPELYPMVKFPGAKRRGHEDRHAPLQQILEQARDQRCIVPMEHAGHAAFRLARRPRRTSAAAGVG